MSLIPWWRKWQPTPVFFLGKFRGQRRLAGYSPVGHKESDMTEWLNTTINGQKTIYHAKLIKIKNQSKESFINNQQSRLQDRKCYQGCRHFMMIKESLHKEDVIILNVCVVCVYVCVDWLLGLSAVMIYVPNNRSSNSMKHKLMEMKGGNRQIFNCSCTL